jgi:hypothetical protein
MSMRIRVAEIFAVIIAISCLAFPCNLPLAHSSNKTEIGMISQQLMNAADYIKNRYDDRMGLVTESEDEGLVNGFPHSRTFWIYSDNLWASKAMRPFYPEIALNISESITPYIDAYNESDMYEVALGTRVPMPFHTNMTISIANVKLGNANYSILANRHGPEDGTIFTDAASYADLSFYLSLDYYLNHNMVASKYWFRTGETLWNGKGFLDKPAKTDQVYQNYKLGLYLLCDKVTGYDSVIYDEVETALWSYQIANGGIASLSYFNGTPCGTANVETTSISLLAFDEQLIQNFGQPKVGAYFYPWWGIPFNNHWDSNAIKGTPFLGEYNSNDSHVADQQVLLAKQNKIDFFTVSWI